MRTIVIKQPWADLIAAGEKSLEIRSWSTSYRGPVLITSGARAATCEHARRWTNERPVDPSRLGITVCVVDLVDVREGATRDARAAGGFDPTGYFSWVLRSPRAVRDLPVKGGLGLRHADPAIVRKLGLR